MSIEAFKKRLHALPGLFQRALEDAAPEIIASLQATQKAGKDPYGDPYAPKKDGSPSSLYDTGDLYRSYAVVKTPQGVTLTNKAPYAQYHQTGAQTLPVRKVLPDDQLTPEMEAILTKAIAKRLKNENS